MGLQYAQDYQKYAQIRAEHEPSIFPGINSVPIEQMVLYLSLLTLLDEVAKHFFKNRDQR